MEKFSDCHTRWEGLWYHPENHNYTSAKLNLASLKGFKGNCRLRMFKNRKKGEGQPTYLFTISSTTEDYDDVEEIEIIQGESEQGIEALIDELADVMRQGNANGDIMALPSESAARAEYLQNRAIEIVEEITGVKWDFSFLTWG